jgi:hypothetical protein
MKDEFGHPISGGEFGCATKRENAETTSTIEKKCGLKERFFLGCVTVSLLLTYLQRANVQYTLPAGGRTFPVRCIPTPLCKLRESGLGSKLWWSERSVGKIGCANSFFLLTSLFNLLTYSTMIEASQIFSTSDLIAAVQNWSVAARFKFRVHRRDKMRIDYRCAEQKSGCTWRVYASAKSSDIDNNPLSLSLHSGVGRQGTGNCLPLRAGYTERSLVIYW